MVVVRDWLVVLMGSGRGGVWLSWVVGKRLVLVLVVFLVFDGSYMGVVGANARGAGLWRCRWVVLMNGVGRPLPLSFSSILNINIPFLFCFSFRL